MSGKSCAECLGKDVHWASLHRLADCRSKSQFYLYYSAICVQHPYFSVALVDILSHNYKDNGHRLTPACTPSASLEHTGRQPPSSRGCNRSSLWRQCILRSERFGAGQVRDAAQRGPKQPHKLNDEAMAVLVEAIQEAGRMLKGEELAALLLERCGVAVHPRSILRRLRPYLQAEKKRR